ncbi:hypothetical protein ACRALDRAFT_212205 [Sodiomyces alcalophilus JCM 7366]|uniref:uncharacterized protein n=1 Tax=Sodiomyces alcalophilus JCM 7366 TaxID=591952 RepID=UPI0039B5470C
MYFSTGNTITTSDLSIDFYCILYSSLNCLPRYPVFTGPLQDHDSSLRHSAYGPPNGVFDILLRNADDFGPPQRQANPPPIVFPMKTRVNSIAAPIISPVYPLTA